MSDFNQRAYETEPLGSRNRSYSKEEAAQVPNQWWDFLDLFRNVPERRIENPYDYDWAKRTEQVEANYAEDGSFISVPNASFTSMPVPRYTREGVLYYTTRKDTDGTSSTYGQPIPDVKEYNQNRPWYRSLPYGLGGEKQGDISDYALASFIFNEGPSVAAPFVALKTAKPKTQNIVMKGKYDQEVTISLNKQGLQDARTLNNALSKDIDTIQNLSRFNNKQSKGVLESVVTGMVTKDDPVALGVQEFDQGSILGMDGQPYALQSTIRRGKDESEDDYANRYFDDLFNQYGLTENAKLNLRRMLDSGSITKHYRKVLKMGISNPDYSLQSFKNTRRALVEEFLFGLEHLGLDPNKIEAHHIASLRQVASLFEGLDRNEFSEMLGLIYDQGIFTGNDPRNLIAIQKKGHYNKKDNPNIYAVHTYLNEKLGLYGEKIVGDFGVEVRDLSPQERIPYIKKFAAVVKGSQPIIDKAIRDVLDLDHLEDSPEAAAIAALDISEYEAELIKEKVDDYLKLQLTEPNYEALMDSIFGGESAGESMRTRGIKPGQPVQSQLFDLGKVKPPRKTNKKNNEYPSGPGAYWDIESE